MISVAERNSRRQSYWSVAATTRHESSEDIVSHVITYHGMACGLVTVHSKYSENADPWATVLTVVYLTRKCHRGSIRPFAMLNATAVLLFVKILA